MPQNSRASVMSHRKHSSPLVATRSATSSRLYAYVGRKKKVVSQKRSHYANSVTVSMVVSRT